MGEESAETETETETRRQFLYGDLDLRIFEARRLPNIGLIFGRVRQCFTACSCKPAASGGVRKIITTDPYVTVCVGGAKVASTRVVSSSHSPSWGERFTVPLAHPASAVELHVKDDDFFGSNLIGTVTLLLEPALGQSKTVSGWFPIVGRGGKPPKLGCALRLEMTFRACVDNPLYRNGAGAIRGAYFPARRGGAVKLYQDAHVPEGALPEIELEDGDVYKHGRCWEDICHAILEARVLVYIVGWSVYHQVRLVREPTRVLPRGGDLNLGDLLRYKSQEGVRVLLLVWDDKTSGRNFFIETKGVMQTHDEETRRFFKHSTVNCVLSPRYASSKLGIFKQKVVGTLYTHHQKCVIVDAKAPGDKCKITAFIGGLDLCDGRYDTPEHRLFSDLDTVFDDDYHNPTFSAGTNGPRQPWHDMHCKIEGPAAYDVLTNFEQRWRKASKRNEFRSRVKRAATHWHDDSLIKLERMSWVISPSANVKGDYTSVSVDDRRLWVSHEEDEESWNVQVFRSIDSGSLKGFPKYVRQTEEQNLVCAKDLVIDKSIQTAYIQAIRCAQHFIYIENQYFIGSSYAWPSYKDAGAENLIPMELALKICSKIRAGERFAVYIVLPMWPEGVPTSLLMQQILFWQGETMKMMFEIIAVEFKSLNLKDSPEDYLNFYCLGSREAPVETHESRNMTSSDKTVSNSQTNQRFMIYVHAKGMIVDDEYVLLGSANINERSLWFKRYGDSDGCISAQSHLEP